MKKVPIILPVIMAVVILALSGILLYTNGRDSSEQVTEMPDIPAQNTEAITDGQAVRDRLTAAREELFAADKVKTDKVKGRRLSTAAMELTVARAQLQGNEESLRYFLDEVSARLKDMGERLTYGGRLTESEKNGLMEIAASLDNAITICTRSVEENNTDYLKGEFSLPAQTVIQLSKEQAETRAKAVREDAAYKEETGDYHSFDAEGYLLYVSKHDGRVSYRRTGYTAEHEELTEKRLGELTEKAKTYLKDKGCGDTVLYEWQYFNGELAMKLYPVAGGTLYLNAPNILTYTIRDGELVGADLSTFTATEVDENDDLTEKLKKEYKDNSYVIKAVSRHGVPSLLVCFKDDSGEYMSLYNADTGEEGELFKADSNAHGRLIYAL